MVTLGWLHHKHQQKYKYHKNYCKSENFHATLIFTLLAHFWASVKLKTWETVYFVYGYMQDGWKKVEGKFKVEG